MSGALYLALFALIAMVTMYMLERWWPLTLLGFSAASTIAAVSEFVLGRWPLGIVALGFAAVASRRWHMRRRQDDRGSFSARFWMRRAL